MLGSNDKTPLAATAPRITPRIAPRQAAFCFPQSKNILRSFAGII
jgi:hypothetical protein